MAITRIRLGNVKDFAEKDIKTFALLGKKIGVFRYKEGDYRAIEMTCKHQAADLQKEEGKFIVSCPRHDWKYDMLTGACLNHDSADLRKFAVHLNNDTLYLELNLSD